MEKTKNTFQDGLIMDFSPDNTSATSLTSALNATILTFNGNEMALQNDMGNGRVETAYLPEGYIPVGTCEFGDIIYIASYNPLTNKSQIGCFPSPERNISSEELGGLQQSLSYIDFQVTDNSGVPTGELKSTAVRKVLIDNRNTNPGDKYIVFSEQASENFDKFGELENSKKYLKLSVVSIDDSGKITYLDTDIHYYQYDGANVVYDHFISPKMIQHGTDVDEYRNMLQSGWNIFSSKNPGKLAILAELNTIDSFSCTYRVLVNEIPANPDNEKYKDGAIKYTVYFIPTFNSSAEHKVYLSRETIYSIKEEDDGLKNIDGVNYFKVTKDQFGQTDLSIYLNNPTEEIPNYHDTNFDNFEGPMPNPESEPRPEPVISGHNYLAFEIEIPYKNGELIKSGALIYSCNIIPAMPFGKLDYLKVPITIDFNKIGTGEVGLTRWRYYNYGTQCTLQYGLEIYNKPGEETKSVTIDFYDNTGHAARYTLENQDSFSGVHTEYLGLNGENYNYRLNRMVGDKYILHKAQEYRNFDINTDTITYWEGEDQKYIGKDPDGNIQSTDLSSLGPGLYQLSMVDNTLIDGSYLVEKKDNTLKIYTNDAGTLYSNLLYAALITVTSDKGSEPKKYWRWLWTNNMYNEYYYQIDDFDNLKFQLDLDVNALFEAAPIYEWKEKTLNNLNNSIEQGCYNTYSANVQYVGQDGENGENNVNLYAYPALQNDYGCFNLIDTTANLFNLDIYLGKSTISYSDSAYEFSLQKASITDSDSKYLNLLSQVNKSNNLTGLENREYIDLAKHLNTLEGGNKVSISDTFNLRYLGDSKYIELKDDDDEIVNYQHISCSLSSCYYATEQNKKSIKLSLAASIFTKAFTCTTQRYTGDCPTYVPIINSQDDLRNIGIVAYTTGDKTSLRFQSAFGGMCNDKEETYTAAPFVYSNGTFTSAMLDDNSNALYGNSFKSYGNSEYVTKVYDNVGSYLSQFFLYYPFGRASYWDYSCVKGNYGAEKVNQIYNMGGNSKWYGGKYGYGEYLISFEADNTEKNADIGGTGGFEGLSNCNIAGILCTKHPNGGFVMLNSYYLDNPSNNTITQTCKYINNVKFTQYPNPSFPLYLILSRIYTKNKTIPTNSDLIKLSNIVRRSQYNTILTKDVVMKLSPKDPLSEGETFNIAMSGINFNEYRDSLLQHIGDVEINKEAVKVQFSDCAKNTVLTIEVNNKQMEFPELENRALLSYNGILTPCDKITDEGFYIYYEDTLTPYYDQEYKFNKQDFITNLSYVLGQTVSDIDYITNTSTLVPTTELEQATDDLALAMSRFYSSSSVGSYLTELTNHRHYAGDEYEFRDIMLDKFLQCFTNSSEYIYDDDLKMSVGTPTEYFQQWNAQYPGISLNTALNRVANQDGFNLRSYIETNMQYSLPDSSGNGYHFIGMYFNFQHAPKYREDQIVITPQLGLSEYFEYKGNTIQINDKETHNYLRFITPHCSYTPQAVVNGLIGVMKDVSVDVTHRITKDDVG